MLPHRVDIREDLDGHPVVEVTFDVSPVQAGAAAHAVRIVRDERYRIAGLSADDVLAMREMTVVADELAAIEAAGAIDHVEVNVARLGVLSSALQQFATGEHPEREGDAEARPVVYSLVDDVADLHAEAVRTALSSTEPVK
jgi:hypothetical protein